MRDKRNGFAKAFDRFCADTGYEEALPVIKEWLADPNPTVRRAVTEGLRIWTGRAYFREHPEVAIQLLSQFIPLGVAVGQLAFFESPLVRLLFGIVCQLAVGTFFIGTFAVSKEGIRPGMALGLKVTALSMAYQLLVVGALFALAAALQTTLCPS